MASSLRSLAPALSLAFVVLLACGGGGEVAAPSQPQPIQPAKPASGLTVLPYSALTDTIGARPAERLLIEYRRADGTLQPGVDIRLEVVDRISGLPDGVRVPVLLASSAPDGAFLLVTNLVTDAAGRAAASIRFGAVAERGRLRVSAPAFGAVDTVAFTVKPGNAASIRFSSADTVITVGGSVSLSATTTDRLGNARTEPVVFTVSRGGTAASLSGGTVRGLAIGQAVIQGAVGPVVDSVRVGVVPTGRLAVVEDRGDASDSVRVYLVNTDLSGKRMLGGPSSYNWSERTPVWSPTGGRLLTQIGMQNPRLFFVDTTTGGATRAIQYSTGLASEKVATYSPDGQWIYFGAVPTYQDEQIWRIRSDGTGAVRVGLPGNAYDIDASPSVSPDGTRLVYFTNRAVRDNFKPLLVTLRLNTQDTTSLRTQGSNPKWSPTGNDIVYIDDGKLKLVRPDGTNQRMIGVQAARYAGYPSWSPDGQWIIASSSTGLHLIRVATGDIIYYPASTRGLGEVAWRP